MHKSTQKALDELTRRIKAGEWSDGSYLPSERALCRELEVGRGALIAIFRELAQQGLISLERGRGVKAAADDSRRLRQILVLENSSLAVVNSSEHIRLLDSISRVSAARNIGVSLSFVGDADPVEPVIDRYGRGEFQAVMVIEQAKLTDIDLLLRYSIPCVVVNYEASGNCPHAKVDFREVGRIAGRKLLEKGYRRIGAISGPPESFFCRELLAGLKGVLAEEDLELLREDILQWEPKGNSSMQKLRQILSSHEYPRAFFAARDWRAAHLYTACRELGLRIPEDIAVISYDNLSWPDAADAGLTTITEPTDDLAAAALNMLIKWNQNGIQPENTRVCGTLIDRGSIG